MIANQLPITRISAAPCRKHKMESALIKRTICALLLSHLILTTQTLASGVVELELVDFRQLDGNPPPIADSGESPFRLVVCLKEAFASQLDGPCALGNASLTIDQIIPARSSQQRGRPLVAPKSNTWRNEDEQAPNWDPYRTQLTNIVRIPFSFRWTKSFTIVLTAQRQVATTSASESGANSNATDAATDRSQSASQTNANQPHQMTSSSGQFAQIDRHVLTENEVLPSWDAASSKASWTTRYLRGLKTSLVYRFRILCATHHFGDDCATFCRPSDDRFGHFQCSPSGQRICLDGWTGNDCAQAKCRSGCDKQHGFCDQPNTCQCRHGWTGERCDECLTYPGCKNGFCLAPWQCVCKPNWSGLLCDQDLNYCASHTPCENNATCQDIAAGRYKCHCPPGFTGLNCQLRLATLVDLSAEVARRHAAGCSQNPCLNGGSCVAVSQQQLVVQSKARTSELEDGQIQLANRSYRCQCPSGFSGDYCQWIELPMPVLEGPPITTTTFNSVDRNTAFDVSATTELRPTTLAEPELDTGLAATLDPSLSLPVPPNELFIHQESRPSNSVEMRHLISGVVIASTVGVFCAALLIAWCCLLAIERGKFQFVQMNFIRAGQMGTNDSSDGFVSSLRRVQAKLRNSMRRDSIKPATKLSLENVLNPARLAPPSYEECNRDSSPGLAENDYGKVSEGLQRLEKNEATTSKEQLVKKGALGRALARKQRLAEESNEQDHTHEPANCPKHGHLYRNLQPHSNMSTMIEIEYKPPDSITDI